MKCKIILSQPLIFNKYCSARCKKWTSFSRCIVELHIPRVFTLENDSWIPRELFNTSKMVVDPTNGMRLGCVAPVWPQTPSLKYTMEIGPEFNESSVVPVHSWSHLEYTQFAGVATNSSQWHQISAYCLRHKLCYIRCSARQGAVTRSITLHLNIITEGKEN